ncbi:MAG: hypothetical protein Q8P41_31035 [Pseudomonadota bacterium]|nr:hypothetical protein [Pseudomonadota bacterium]
MTLVDVALDYPVVVTERFSVNEAAPEAVPLTGGLVVDVGVSHFGNVDIVVTGAARGWGATWDRTPNFTARIWDGGVDFGARFAPGAEEALVHGWWGAGSGVRFGLLDVDWWDDVFTWGLGAWTGGGVDIGRGKVRGTLSVRGDVSLRVDSWNGTVVTSGETTTWSYWPGSARVSVMGGVAFR